ncbi:MAG: UPF0147 family protein [Nanoarchaeota archaeon]|nr:UPF0147 family protein [Nanoarchaeota archaeon]
MEAKINDKDVLRAIKELKEDSTVPRNVRSHLEKAEEEMKTEEEMSVRVNKALNALEDVTEDMNIQPYTRSQLWNVVSMLEKLH